MSFESNTTAPVPLDMLEGITRHLDNDEVSKALFGQRMETVELTLKGVERTQEILIRRLDDQDVLLSTQAKAAAKSAEVAEENNAILNQLRDLFTAGRVGTNLLAWLGKAWPGLVVLGYGIRELYKAKFG